MLYRRDFSRSILQSVLAKHERGWFTFSIIQVYWHRFHSFWARFLFSFIVNWASHQITVMSRRHCISLVTCSKCHQNQLENAIDMKSLQSLHNHSLLSLLLAACILSIAFLTNTRYQIITIYHSSVPYCNIPSHTVK